MNRQIILQVINEFLKQNQETQNLIKEICETIQLSKQDQQAFQEKMAVLNQYINDKKQLKETEGKIRQTRGIVEGVFDLTHFGHFGVIRQAKQICDQVILLINSDKAVLEAKGPTVYNEQERLQIGRACKWVDEIDVVDAYVLGPEILSKYEADFVVHGDDIIYDQNGESIYTPFERIGKFWICQRTTGISTTDLVNKILKREFQSRLEDQFTQKQNKYFQSISNIFWFAEKLKPKSGTVVYVSGSFDVLNPGHIKFLEVAKSQGDFLIVGLFSDKQISIIKKNQNYPFLGIYERALNLLSLQMVDDIILNAPLRINKAFVMENKVDKIVTGSNYYLQDLELIEFDNEIQDKLVQVSSGSDFTFNTLVQRIDNSWQEYQKVIEIKLQKQDKYYDNKYQEKKLNKKIKKTVT